MPSRNRTFSSADVIRIIDDHLTLVEREEVRFAITTRRMRSAMGTVFDPESPRLIEKLLNRIGALKGGAK